MDSGLITDQMGEGPGSVSTLPAAAAGLLLLLCALVALWVAASFLGVSPDLSGMMDEAKKSLVIRTAAGPAAPPRSGLCGNGRIDAGEDCDSAGLVDMYFCSWDCRFKGERNFPVYCQLLDGATATHDERCSVSFGRLGGGCVIGTGENRCLTDMTLPQSWNQTHWKPHLSGELDGSPMASSLFDVFTYYVFFRSADNEASESRLSVEDVRVDRKAAPYFNDTDAIDFTFSVRNTGAPTSSPPLLGVRVAPNKGYPSGGLFVGVMHYNIGSNQTGSGMMGSYLVNSKETLDVNFTYSAAMDKAGLDDAKNAVVRHVTVPPL